MSPICPASGKTMHDSRAAARSATINGWSGPRPDTETYRCPDCGAWHVSSKRNRKAQKRAARAFWRRRREAAA